MAAMILLLAVLPSDAPLASAPAPFPGPAETLRSPDGRWLLVHASRKGKDDPVLKAPHELLLLDLKGGTSARILSYGRHADACFSPDGRHLLLTEWTGADTAAIRLFRLEKGLERVSLDRWAAALTKEGRKGGSFQALGWQDDRTFRVQWWDYSGEGERKGFRLGLELKLDGAVKELYPKGQEESAEE
jgi:hypothetical protein